MNLITILISAYYIGKFLKYHYIWSLLVSIVSFIHQCVSQKYTFKYTTQISQLLAYLSVIQYALDKNPLGMILAIQMIMYTITNCILLPKDQKINIVCGIVDIFLVFWIQSDHNGFPEILVRCQLTLFYLGLLSLLSSEISKREDAHQKKLLYYVDHVEYATQALDEMNINYMIFSTNRQVLTHNIPFQFQSNPDWQIEFWIERIHQIIGEKSGFEATLQRESIRTFLLKFIDDCRLIPKYLSTREQQSLSSFSNEIQEIIQSTTKVNQNSFYFSNKTIYVKFTLFPDEGWLLISLQDNSHLMKTQNEKYQEYIFQKILKFKKK